MSPNSECDPRRSSSAIPSSLFTRLEEEEHGRQKLQIERVQFEGKIKNFEDIVASQQNELGKVGR